MPGVVTTAPVLQNQVTQNAQAPTTQKNFRQMCGEVQEWNPDAPALMVETWVKNAYRRVIDKRNWVGLMVRGQVTVPNAYTTGQATFTANSETVQGYGTAWDNTMKGRQVRSGFSTGFYNIAAVDPSAQTLTLDLPWGNPTITRGGYQMVQTWVTLGPNIKMVLEMVNQRQGYRLKLHVPQKWVNARDTWRTTTGWTRALVNKEPTANGWPQYELWPAPTYQQAFPFLAYTQAPDFDDDNSYPASFISSDIIVLGALPDALLFKGNQSRYYNPTTATYKKKEFDAAVLDMMMKDEDLYPKDLLDDSAETGSLGATWEQSHDEPPY